ncbi:hypothetical protein Bca4012_037757 [Brassica carinata]
MPEAWRHQQVDRASPKKLGHEHRKETPPPPTKLGQGSHLLAQNPCSSRRAKNEIFGKASTSHYRKVPRASIITHYRAQREITPRYSSYQELTSETSARAGA